MISVTKKAHLVEPVLPWIYRAPSTGQADGAGLRIVMQRPSESGDFNLLMLALSILLHLRLRMLPTRLPLSPSNAFCPQSRSVPSRF